MVIYVWTTSSTTIKTQEKKPRNEIKSTNQWKSFAVGWLILFYSLNELIHEIIQLGREKSGNGSRFWWRFYIFRDFFPHWRYFIFVSKFSEYVKWPLTSTIYFLEICMASSFAVIGDQKPLIRKWGKESRFFVTILHFSRFFFAIKTIVSGLKTM